MNSFTPPTEYRNQFSPLVHRHQTLQPRDDPAPDCPRQCDPLDYSTVLQLPNSNSSNIFGHGGYHDGGQRMGAAFASNSLSMSLPDPMQLDDWGAVAQPSGSNDSSHNRRSSLSSTLDAMTSHSSSPVSRFASQASNSHLAISDFPSDRFAASRHDEKNATRTGPQFQLSRSLKPYSPLTKIGSTLPEMAYPVTIPGPDKGMRVDRNYWNAPDFSADYGRSYPASAASSIAGDSPPTPTVGEADQFEARRNNRENVPKLDRTLTDVYSDELYSPNFSITSTSPPQIHTNDSSRNDLFTQRIDAANHHHLSAAHPTSPTTSRARSPFQTSSLSPNHVPNYTHDVLPLNSVPRWDHPLFGPQQGPLQAVQSKTAKTISPKDSVLEFTDADEAESMPLFPPQPTNWETDQSAKNLSGPNTTLNPEDFIYEDDENREQSRDYDHNDGDIDRDLPAVEISSHEEAHSLVSPPSMSLVSRIADNMANGDASTLGAAADGGTYTCTYHGCSVRFETPLLLQKHKREGHRHSQGSAGSRPQDVGSTPGLLNTQAGPHRCDRINPSTGKPCSTVFSRPYDLTRHEDTIHNARKQKVRCGLCTEEKTFSRADALTRHYRVCHPDVELPGKHRRRS